MNSTSAIMMAATKFRRLSAPQRKEAWIQQSEREENQQQNDDNTGDSTDVVLRDGKIGINKFRGAVKTTLLAVNRRRSDTVLLTNGKMSDINRRRGTIFVHNTGKRRSADAVMKDGKFTGVLNTRKAEEKRRIANSPMATSGICPISLCELFQAKHHIGRKFLRKKLIQKFRIIARSVGCMIHLSQKVIDDNEDSLTYRPEMKRLTEVLAASDGQVPCVNRIDISYYKANTQMRMSQEGKRILSKLPKDRTEKEIQYATIALRNVKTIADYPLHIQQQLATYGFFESYEAKRVVVKEGRPSENYYVLIYGQVMFAKIDEANMAKKIGSLYRGYYFGELGIYNRTPRQSSIITELYTELLRVSDVDFMKIFMGGDLTQNPEKDSFLKNVIYLKGWPLHVLKGNTKSAMTSYFQRDAIMTRDSNLSEWIYIIKSGSIRVMKKLVKTEANTSKKTGLHKQLAHTDAFSAFLSNENEYQRYTLYNDIETPPPLCMEGDSIQDNDENRESPLTLPLMLKLQRACRPHTAKADLIPSKARSRRRLSLSWASGYERHLTNKSTFNVASTPVQSPKNSPLSDTENSSQVQPPQNEGRRTIFDDWDAATKYKKQELTEADLNPQFVQVQTLTKGQVFGLQYILYKGHPQPSFIVISNGAECVKINRRIFEEHLNFTVRSELLKLVPPYPDDDYLQSKLVTEMNWGCYKDVLIHNIIDERDKQNPKKYGQKYPRIKLK